MPSVEAQTLTLATSNGCVTKVLTMAAPAPNYEIKCIRNASYFHAVEAETRHSELILLDRQVRVQSLVNCYEFAKSLYKSGGCYCLQASRFMIS